MKPLLKPIAMALLAGYAAVSAAHHSFAVYDFQTEKTYVGTVEKLSFRNPHMSMTMRIKDETGADKIIDFVEGAPANMLLRMGLKPDMIKVGTHLTAIGSPRHDNPDALFLKTIKLDDGQTFNTLGGGAGRPPPPAGAPAPAP